jgi:hypothetical protein
MWASLPESVFIHLGDIPMQIKMLSAVAAAALLCTTSPLLAAGTTSGHASVGKPVVTHIAKKAGKKAAKAGKKGDFLSAADTNKDGVVSHDEFFAAMDKHFKKLDKNNDGKLTADEVKGGKKAK